MTSTLRADVSEQPRAPRERCSRGTTRLSRAARMPQPIRYGESGACGQLTMCQGEDRARVERTGGPASRRRPRWNQQPPPAIQRAALREPAALPEKDETARI